MGAQERAARARQSFMSGCNCPQSVVSAFDDVFERNGIDRETILRLASPFGGGMGRLREVCGAVSGALMVLGVLEGYDDPSADGVKAELYVKVQELASSFRSENGSYMCRELLGLPEGPDKPQPQTRNAQYYASRPCADLVASAARILGKYVDGE